MNPEVLARGWVRGVAMHRAEEQRKAALLQQQGYQQQHEQRQFGFERQLKDYDFQHELQKAGVEHTNRLDEIKTQNQNRLDVETLKGQGKGKLAPKDVTGIYNNAYQQSVVSGNNTAIAQQDANAAVNSALAFFGGADWDNTGAPEPWKPTVDASPPVPIPMPAPPTPQPMGQTFPDVANPTRFTSTDVRPNVAAVMNAIQQVRGQGQPDSVPPMTAGAGFTPPAGGNLLDQKKALKDYLTRTALDPNTPQALRSRAEGELPAVQQRIEHFQGLLNPPSGTKADQMPPNLSPKAQNDWRRTHGQLDANAERARHNRETEGETKRYHGVMNEHYLRSDAALTTIANNRLTSQADLANAKNTFEVWKAELNAALTSEGHAVTQGNATAKLKAGDVLTPTEQQSAKDLQAQITILLQKKLKPRMIKGDLDLEPKPEPFSPQDRDELLSLQNRLKRLMIAADKRIQTRQEQAPGGAAQDFLQNNPPPQGVRRPFANSSGDPAANVRANLDRVNGPGTFDAVDQIFRNAGISTFAWTHNANRESGGNPNATGDGGTSFGLFQLHRGGYSET
jgi:hypothetical protein